MAKRLLSIQKVVNLASDPVTGSAGELYYNTTTNNFKYYNGTAWTEITGGGGNSTITVSETAPSSPTQGNLWYNSAQAKLLIYYDNVWVEAGGPGAYSPYELQELDNVLISSPQNGQGLVYESSTGLWKNQNVDALPTQSGNSGKYLTTNGTVASWGTIDLSAYAPLNSPTLTGTPSAPTASAATNTTQIATTAFVRTEISNLIDTAPSTLDTLNELAAALGDDPNFATTITTALAGKEPTITSGTTLQYWRGDKSWQTLDKSAVGLANVENTALSTWAGSSNIATVGTVTSGTWQGSVISATYIDSSIARLASPTFTGVPLAPTAAADTNTTQIATTAFVIGQGYLKSSVASTTYAPLNSPALTGTPTAPTPPTTSDDTRIATTAWVNSVIGTREVIPLDDISSEFDGRKLRFIAKYDNEVVVFTNPYELILMINGIIQKVGHPDVVWQSGIPREGFFLDWEGFIQFSEAPPAGSSFDARLFPVSSKDNSLYYPFSAVDIYLGA